MDADTKPIKKPSEKRRRLDLLVRLLAWYNRRMANDYFDASAGDEIWKEVEREIRDGRV